MQNLATLNSHPGITADPDSLNGFMVWRVKCDDAGNPVTDAHPYDEEYEGNPHLLNSHFVPLPGGEWSVEAMVIGGWESGGEVRQTIAVVYCDPTGWAGDYANLYLYYERRGLGWQEASTVPGAPDHTLLRWC